MMLLSSCNGRNLVRTNIITNECPPPIYMRNYMPFSEKKLICNANKQFCIDLANLSQDLKLCRIGLGKEE